MMTLCQLRGCGALFILTCVLYTGLWRLDIRPTWGNSLQTRICHLSCELPEGTEQPNASPWTCHTSQDPQTPCTVAWLQRQEILQVGWQWSGYQKYQPSQAVFPRLLCDTWNRVWCFWSEWFPQPEWSQCFQQSFLHCSMEPSFQVCSVWAPIRPEDQSGGLHGVASWPPAQFQFTITEGSQEKCWQYTDGGSRETRRRTWRTSQWWEWREEVR